MQKLGRMLFLFGILFIILGTYSVEASLTYSDSDYPKLQSVKKDIITSTFINNTNSSIYWGNYFYGDYDMLQIKSDSENAYKRYDDIDLQDNQNINFSDRAEIYTDGTYLYLRIHDSTNDPQMIFHYKDIGSGVVVPALYSDTGSSFVLGKDIYLIDPNGVGDARIIATHNQFPTVQKYGVFSYHSATNHTHIESTDNIEMALSPNKVFYITNIDEDTLRYFQVNISNGETFINGSLRLIGSANITESTTSGYEKSLTFDDIDIIKWGADTNGDFSGLPFRLYWSNCDTGDCRLILDDGDGNKQDLEVSSLLTSSMYSNIIYEGGVSLASKYQPLENQRLSTTNNVTHNQLATKTLVLSYPSPFYIDARNDVYQRLFGAYRYDINLTSGSTKYPMDFTFSTGTNGVYGSNYFRGAYFVANLQQTTGNAQTGEIAGFYGVAYANGKQSINTKMSGAEFAVNVLNSNNVTQLNGGNFGIIMQGANSTITTASAMRTYGYLNHANQSVIDLNGLYVDTITRYAGNVTTAKGIYIKPQTAGNTNYAIYQEGLGMLSYFEGNISANEIIDRTPAFTGTTSDALELLKSVSSKTDSKGNVEIDHETIPEFARATIREIEKTNCKNVTKDIIQVDAITKEQTKIKVQEEVCNEKVIEKDGRSLGAMITLQTEAIQELSKQIDLLKAENEILKARITNLEKAMSQK